ncbi:bifunctional sulfate adenylyltransferase/adenylylsulfate kinase [Candidatus Hydrogenedentota bacterium]
MSKLNTPYRGELVNLLPSEEDSHRWFEEAQSLPSVQISERSLCDLELIVVGGFSPLKTFLGKGDYEGVLENMRLTDGTLWPMPITLPIDPPEGMQIGKRLALRNAKNNLVAVMEVEEIYEWNMTWEAECVLGSCDPVHPLVAEMDSWGKVCVSGPLHAVELPKKWDFLQYRLTPQQVREKLKECIKDTPDGEVAPVVAFQTRNPLHRAHEELTKRAAEGINGALLIHPVVGMTKPGDVDHFTRCRIYKTLYENYYDKSKTALAFLPLAMRMGGPQEALLHGIIRRNYGVSHFIIGRDHAGPGNDSQGKPFYGPYDAQDQFMEHSDELGVTMVPFKMLLYLPGEDRYEEADKIPGEVESVSISGTEMRDKYLARGKALPEWFTRRETAQILGEAYPSQDKHGFCVWFTGLSGSGKSTTAEILTDLLMECGRAITLLDGDVVRTHLSKGLGFSKEDRDANILRMGYVASEIVSHGGAVICAAVTPYRATRQHVRNMMPDDAFIEVFVDTSLNECEKRDVKGLYAKARKGEIKGFTGIDDPYENPVNPEVVLDTVHQTALKNAQHIVALLHERGFLNK